MESPEQPRQDVDDQSEEAEFISSVWEPGHNRGHPDDEEEDDDAFERCNPTTFKHGLMEMIGVTLSLLLGFIEFDIAVESMGVGRNYAADVRRVGMEVDKLGPQCEVLAVRHESITQERTWIALDGIERPYSVCLDLYWYNFTFDSNLIAKGDFEDNVIEESGPEWHLRSTTSCEESAALLEDQAHAIPRNASLLAALASLPGHPDFSPSSYTVGDRVDCWRPRFVLDPSNYSFADEIECGRPVCRLSDALSCDTPDCVQLSDPAEQASDLANDWWFWIGVTLFISGISTFGLTFVSLIVRDAPCEPMGKRRVVFFLLMWFGHVVVLTLTTLYAVIVKEITFLRLTNPVRIRFAPAVRYWTRLLRFVKNASVLAIILLFLSEVRRTWRRAVPGRGTSGPSADGSTSYNEAVRCYIFFVFFVWYVLIRTNYLYDWGLGDLD